ncbi:hypothetical protein [Zhongshania sp.]|uniref:hypothetical protein n=1 Tax=Zhongshania sp. TaxID=1971902 RepID=UPI001B5E072F|nr:hypothetical protein [Zhongshania sp.]MBQ0794774.1 hypothetical protein [Zhongshania sp.]
MLAQKESKQRKKAPCITVDGKKRHRNPARFTSNGAASVPREKYAFGSNSFSLNPLLAAVLSGVEGIWALAESFVVLFCLI